MNDVAMLSEKEAWLLLAKWLEDVAGVGMLTWGPSWQFIGLCGAIDNLTAIRRISGKTSLAMHYRIDAEFDRIAFDDSYLWPLDCDGHKQRRQFCLAQAAELEKEAASVQQQ